MTPWPPRPFGGQPAPGAEVNRLRPAVVKSPRQGTVAVALLTVPRQRHQQAPQPRLLPWPPGHPPAVDARQADVGLGACWVVTQRRITS
jgi:hypothetical protein